MIKVKIFKNALKKRINILLGDKQVPSEAELMVFSENIVEGTVMAQNIIRYLKGIYGEDNKIPYSEWWCGITNNVEATIARHKSDFAEEHYFKSFQCSSEEAARFGESYFISIDRGEDKMQGDEGGGNPEAPPNIIYVFKRR